MADVDVILSGPWVDGRFLAAMDRGCKAAERDVAAQGYSYVAENLNASIKHPTPYYETQITVQELGGMRVIHDRGIVYGPWLEGTGSRNQTTRFKGYHSFRRAAQRLRAVAPALVANALAPFIRSVS